MFDNKRFQRLVEQRQPTGEVISADRFIVEVEGLESISTNSRVLFENGSEGIVREVKPDRVLVLNLNSEEIPIGTLVALDSDEFTTSVGEALIGRVVNVLCQPLDDKGPLNLPQTAPVFASAPGIIDRVELEEQMATGVTVVDTLFPIVLGQRMAILGDNKSGKTAFLTQASITQARAGKIIVHVMICKRKVDIDALISRLQTTDTMKNCIVVVANVFDSLAQAYLAPYVGCAIAEHLWQHGQDVVVVYDDLSTHAKVYREISLLSKTSPGRDSYPGDMFYAHSSLLERAGRLASNKATFTALPVVLSPNEDITAYLPTNTMSITDGQIIFDLKAFREGIRPAISTGLSVSRVGIRNPRQRAKHISSQILKKLAAYKDAAQFARFGSDLSAESQASLAIGQMIYEGFKQRPDELWSQDEQELLLSSILATQGQYNLDISAVKGKLNDLAAKIQSDDDFDQAVADLTAAHRLQEAV